MRNLYLVQPNFPVKPGHTDEYFLPYTVGVLWASAQQNQIVKQNWRLAEIIFRREPVADVISRMTNPDMVVFSCYVWNWNYNKKLAASIKKLWPGCVILFGGPQVTNRPFETLFLAKHPYVDTVINGEGELIFTEILTAIAESQKIKRIYKQDRIQDLSDMPSAYLSGVFDQLINDNLKIKWQAVLETNRGCPYACTFCDWGSVTHSKIKKFDIQRVLGEIKWFADHGITYLFIADANFGIFHERDLLIAKTVAEHRQRTGYPEVVNVTWQKNSNVRSVEINKVLGSKAFTVSAQSMNFDTLKAIKRDGMQVNDARVIFENCQQANIATYTDLILGLPEESKQSWRRGIYDLLNLGQHNPIMVYGAVILENAEMAHQVEKYDLKWTNQDFWASHYHVSLDPEREYQRTVIGTSTMPFDDMVDCYVFAWMIFTFHSTGYTQIFSRYMNHNGLLTHPEFYEKLWDFLHHDHGFLGREQQRIRNSTRECLTTGTWVPPAQLGMKNLTGDTLRDSTLLLFANDTALVKTELNQFFDRNLRVKFFTDPETYDQLCALQELFTADFWRQYPVKLELDTDIYNSIFNSTNSTGKIQINIDLNSRVFSSDINQFRQSIFINRKSSVAKTLLTVDHTCPA